MRYRSATMTPGAKRPPPIGSEDVSVGFEGGEERGREYEGCCRGVAIRAAGPSGAMVSRFSSETAVLPSTVASGSTSSMGLPQWAQ